MKVKGIDPNTGNEVEVEIENPEGGFFEAMRDFDMSDDGIKRLIDKLDISADSKSLLYTFSKATVKVGEYVIKIGRKILDCVCLAFREYPKATFGIVFGAILGALVSAIPIIGVVLGPIVTPILMALGLGVGIVLDVNNELGGVLAKIVTAFTPLSAK